MKKEQRQTLREILGAISEEDIKERSIIACNLLCGQPEFQKAEIMMTFLSLAREIDTSSLVLRAWMERTRVLAPKVSWEQRRMLPIEITSLTQDIRDTPVGIREPAGGSPIPVANIDLVIVPGLVWGHQRVAIHLRQPRDPRTQQQPLHAEVVIRCNLIGQRGTRSDQRHLPTQHVYKLGKFVDLQPAHDSPDRRDLRMIQRHEFFGVRRAVAAHGAKLG